METYQLDVLDKKILNYINLNVRASYSQIAKNVRSSKENVNYRINRLIERRIIKEFITILGLGYWASKILIQFKQMNPEKEKEMINYLSNHNNVTWLTSCSGNWDLVFVIMAQDPKHFSEIFNKIMEKLGEHIREYKMATSIGSQTYGHTYILNSIKESKRIKRNDFKQLNLDSKDKKILTALLKSARIKFIDIHRKTNIPIDTIKYRISKMEKDQIIKRYRLILDSSKLGYNRYELFIRSVNLNQELIKRFEEYAERTPEVEHFGRFTGNWDIEFTIHLKNNDKLREFILNLKSLFGDHIQSIESIILFDTIKYTYLPEEIIN